MSIHSTSPVFTRTQTFATKRGGGFVFGTDSNSWWKLVISKICCEN